MKNTFEKLNKYWNHEKYDKIIFNVGKAFLLVFIGVFIKELITSKIADLKIVGYLVGFIIFWIVIEVRMLIKDKNFPISILNHLTAEKDLEDLNKKFVRKEIIDEYISNSISQLNSNTCPIQFEIEQENQLCHQNVQDSLYYVLEDLILRTQNFLNTDLTDFTVGIYISNIYDPSNKEMAVKKPVSHLFRDDFFVDKDFPDQIEHLVAGLPAKFYLQSKIQEVIKLNSFVSEHKIINQKNYLFVISNIPNVCEDCPPDGALVLISKQKAAPPEDLENILKIFGQIVSNWTSKFNDCILKECKAKESKIQLTDNIVNKLVEPAKE